MIHLVEESRRLLEKLGQVNPATEEKEKEKEDPLQGYINQKDFMEDQNKEETPKWIDPQEFYANPLNPALDAPSQEVMERTLDQAQDNYNAFGVKDPALQKDIKNSFYARQDPSGGGTSTSIMANKLNRAEMDSIVGQNGFDASQNIDLIGSHNKGLQRWEDRTVSQFLSKNRLSGAGSENRLEQDDRSLG